MFTLNLKSTNPEVIIELFSGAASVMFISSANTGTAIKINDIINKKPKRYNLSGLKNNFFNFTIPRPPKDF